MHAENKKITLQQFITNKELQSLHYSVLINMHEIITHRYIHIPSAKLSLFPTINTVICMYSCFEFERVLSCDFGEFNHSA